MARKGTAMTERGNSGPMLTATRGGSASGLSSRITRMTRGMADEIPAWVSKLCPREGLRRSAKVCEGVSRFTRYARARTCQIGDPFAPLRNDGFQRLSETRCRRAIGRNLAARAAARRWKDGDERLCG